MASTEETTKADATTKKPGMGGEMVIGAGTTLEYPTLMQMIVTRDGKAALDWYAQALGGEVVCQYNDGEGRVMHAVVRASFGALIGVEDYYPKMHIVQPLGEEEEPEESAAKGSTYVYVIIPKGKGSCDEAVERMRECGATVVKEPTDTFYGHRVGQVMDKYGLAWAFGHEIEVKDNGAEETVADEGEKQNDGV